MLFLACFCVISPIIYLFLPVSNWLNARAKRQIRTHTTYVKIRNCTDADVQNFSRDLTDNQIFNQLGQHLSTDPNINYDAFHKWLQNSKETHLPLKTVKFNKYRHKKSKWITNSLLRSIKFRDSLYAKTKQQIPGSLEHERLKTKLSTFNSILKKLIRQCKKDYHFAQFEKYKSASTTKATPTTQRNTTQNNIKQKHKKLKHWGFHCET